MPWFPIGHLGGGDKQTIKQTVHVTHPSVLSLRRYSPQLTTGFLREVFLANHLLSTDKLEKLRDRTHRKIQNNTIKVTTANSQHHSFAFSSLVMPYEATVITA